jgi:nucleotide-binding universal stress UspA family protein
MIKTIIVFTDYSKQSEHAAKYAIHLAKKIKANILISDAVIEPNPVYASYDAGSRSVFETPDDVRKNNRLLKFCDSLENELVETILSDKFVPAIYCQPAEMSLIDTARHFEESLDAAFIMLAVSLYYGASSIMAGDTCKKILASSSTPVILVPEDAPIRYTEKYAFVADINNNNVSTLGKVAELAAYSAAEVMLVNINNGRPLDKAQEGALRLIMKETICQIDYGRIYYRHLPNEILKDDMEWLMQDTRFEMLVVVHSKNNTIIPLLQFNYNNKIVGNIDVPVLIYPTID